MPTVRFAYKSYFGNLAPIIPLRVLGGASEHRWRRILVYVDSGAAYSILTVENARKLGLLKIKARRLAVTTSGGQIHRISLHRLWVKLGNDRFSVTFGVPRGFDIAFNLLGRRDFFSRYQVSFDDSKGVLLFTRSAKLKSIRRKRKK
ncbi:MAG: hypothetical protein NC819_02430 [Candidatus Omnitrophica bacterium]|nr:hypothetical protein [Candidatus Omnitrophota bacterium]